MRVTFANGEVWSIPESLAKDMLRGVDGAFDSSEVVGPDYMITLDCSGAVFNDCHYRIGGFELRKAAATLQYFLYETLVWQLDELMLRVFGTTMATVRAAVIRPTVVATELRELRSEALQFGVDPDKRNCYREICKRFVDWMRTQLDASDRRRVGEALHVVERRGMIDVKAKDWDNTLTYMLYEYAVATNTDCDFADRGANKGCLGAYGLWQTCPCDSGCASCCRVIHERHDSREGISWPSRSRKRAGRPSSLDDAEVGTTESASKARRIERGGL